jgi:hypothetical protein
MILSGAERFMVVYRVVGDRTENPAETAPFCTVGLGFL